MRVDTKIITNLNDATVCAEKWLQQAFDDEVECNWKHRRSEYLAKLVLASLRRYNWLKHIETIWITAEVFNLLQFHNTVSYLWVTDVSNRKYAIPNYLTPRQLNIKIQVNF